MNRLTFITILVAGLSYGPTALAEYCIGSSGNGWWFACDGGQSGTGYGSASAANSAALSAGCSTAWGGFDPEVDLLIREDGEAAICEAGTDWEEVLIWDSLDDVANASEVPKRSR